MGDEMDKLEKELELLAAKEAGKAAATSAWQGIKSAVGGLADDVLGYAERELASAEAARGRGTITHAPGDIAPSDASERALETVRRAAPPGAADSAMSRRRAREQRAREQLEALKQAHLEGRPLRPPPEPEEEIVPAATAQPAEVQPVPRSLDGGADHPVQPEDRAPAKRTL